MNDEFYFHDLCLTKSYKVYAVLGPDGGVLIATAGFPKTKG